MELGSSDSEEEAKRKTYEYRLRRIYEDPTEFFQRFRLSRRQFELLRVALADKLILNNVLNKRNGWALSPDEKILCALRFFCHQPILLRGNRCPR